MERDEEDDATTHDGGSIGDQLRSEEIALGDFSDISWSPSDDRTEPQGSEDDE